MDKIIVIAEDNKELNTLIRIRLEKSGYSVFSCFDGASAYEKVVESKPNLIILDIDLPDIYGFELLGKIRNNPDLINTKVLVLTGVTTRMGDRTPDEKWKDMTGVNAFLSKPYNTDEFFKKIQELLKEDK
jgi:DNA-binding response OmpR family regulator